MASTLLPQGTLQPSAFGPMGGLLQDVEADVRSLWSLEDEGVVAPRPSSEISLGDAALGLASGLGDAITGENVAVAVALCRKDLSLVSRC